MKEVDSRVDSAELKGGSWGSAIFGPSVHKSNITHHLCHKVTVTYMVIIVYRCIYSIITYQ